MAVIEKIRQRSGLLILIIGLALLSFLISDAISNNMGLFRGTDNTVGVIAGKDITYPDFSEKIALLSESVEKQGQPVNDFTLNMIREQIWNEYFQNLVIDEQYEDLGIQVTGAEIYATVTNPVDFPQLRDAPGFKNQTTQQFDPALVIQYLKQMDQDPSGDTKRSWVNFETTVIKPQLVQRKYNTLVAKGVYRTSLEVKADFMANNASHDAKIVGFNFNSIIDDSVAVSEEEMRDYLKTHEADYQQEASRRIEYVIFDLAASPEDSAKTLQWTEGKKTAFANAPNDTFFIQNNGTGFDTTFKPRGSFPVTVEDSIFNGSVKAVYGPVFDAGEYKLFKVLAFQEDSVPYIKASQILVKPRGGFGKEDSLEAVKRANEMATALRKGADFTKMAKDSSQDYRTAANGGDLGWIKKGAGALPEAVERSLFTTPEGGIVVVRSSGGVHILKVTGGKTFRTAQVGQVGRSVQYSSITERDVYDKAFKFAAESQEGTAFTDNAEKSGYAKRISPDLKEGETDLPNITNAREVIRWAFNQDTELGAVSPVISSDDKFIVAQLVNVKEEGTAKLEDVKEKLEADTRIHKKAEILKKRIEAAMGENKTIEQIALDLGAIVNSSPNTLFANPNIPFVGADPILVGAIAGAELNKLSGPIQTKNGVYIFVVSARTEPQPPADLDIDRTRLIQEASAQAPTRAFEALKKKADIKDYRYKFF